MPHVVNGCGTWYSGKQNIVARKGACQACGSWVDLRSYDTTLFIVFVFIPLIPLKRVHIIDDCPACRRHRVVKQVEWDKIKSESLKQALDDLNAKPGDRTAAMNAIATAVGLQDDNMMLGVSAMLEETCGDDAQVLAALAEGYDYFGHHIPAEAALRKAVHHAPNDASISRQFGVHLLMHGSVDEGMKQVGPLLDDPKQLEPGPLLLGIEAYQAAGRHAEALTLMDRIEQKFPRAAKQASFVKARKQSRKLERSGKPLRSALVNAKAPRQATERPWMAKVPWLIGPALGMIAIAWYLGAAWWIGGHHRVFVVNGLNRAYTAQLGGMSIGVPAHGHATLRVPEGKHVLKMLMPGTHATEHTVAIESSFFSRPFQRDVIVINPDTTALLVREEVSYGSSAAGGTPSGSIHTGEALQRFVDVDYAFEEPPASMSVSSSTSVVRKHHLFQPQGLSTARKLEILDRESGAAVALACARAGLLADPDDSDNIEFVLRSESPEKAVSLFEPLLGDRPVRIPLHRAWQDAVRPGRAVAKEYRSSLSQSPDDPRLKYLLARCTGDHAERDRLLKESLPDPVAGPYAAVASAYGLIAEGRFEEALQVSKRSTSDSVARDLLEHQQCEALHALGRFDEILQRPSISGPIADMKWPELTRRAYFVLRRDGRVAAEKLVAEYLDPAIDESEDGQAAKQAKESFGRTLAYCDGDPGPLVASAASERPTWTAILASGNLESLNSSAAPPPPYSAANASMVVAIVAWNAGKDDIARSRINAAAEALGASSEEQHQLASWLRGQSRPSETDALKLNLQPADKCAALIVLSHLYPEIRGPCLNLARRLNYNRQLPYLDLKRALEMGERVSRP